MDAIVIENKWKIGKESDLLPILARYVTRPYLGPAIPSVSGATKVPFIYDPRQGRIITLDARVRPELEKVYEQRKVKLQSGEYHFAHNLEGDLLGIIELHLKGTIRTPSYQDLLSYTNLLETARFYNLQKGKLPQDLPQQKKL